MNLPKTLSTKNTKGTNRTALVILQPTKRGVRRRVAALHQLTHRAER